MSELPHPPPGPLAHRKIGEKLPESEGAAVEMFVLLEEPGELFNDGAAGFDGPLGMPANFAVQSHPSVVRTSFDVEINAVVSIERRRCF